MDSATYRLGLDGDEIYAELLALHEGLSEAESAALNARLVLLLVNAVGERSRVEAAFAAARRPKG
ncbi:DUF2783 domain-containing protein [Acuticoccus mangrovi]|uniref:DUF2783 domain-containing protein n=1 Tax=Acuticoccus mangrovi TaxID=2796142 RepID=A0A934IKV6_9HYPH|nr:DUF2783 domain-containing protein [Acuticoccus mangrovi]MBJ3774157.1 DUF2783 domain-containing protein [Acuticoccus mangrovi]